MDLKVITLPSGDEIVRRCSSIVTMDYMQARFLPHLHKLGGRELVGPGVVMALTLAIYDFTSAGKFPPIVGTFLNMKVPDLVRAIVDDPEVVADAMEMLEEVEGQG